VAELLEKAVVAAAEFGLTTGDVRRLLEERLKHSEVER
jgi:hypothetical protein